MRASFRVEEKLLETLGLRRLLAILGGLFFQDVTHRTHICHLIMDLCLGLLFDVCRGYRKKLLVI